MPHGGQHVAERLSLGHVEMNVARRDQRHARAMRQRRKPIEPLLIVAAMVQFGEEVAAVGEDLAVGGRRGREGEREREETNCAVSATRPLPLPLTPPPRTLPRSIRRYARRYHRASGGMLPFRPGGGRG